MQSTISAPGSDAQDPIAQARRALDGGRLDEAEEIFRRQLEDREAADAYKGLGDVLLRRGRLDQAAEHYWAALGLRPLWPEAENNLGSVRKLQGDAQAAEQHYRRALDGDPRFAAANNNLGVLLAETGRLEEAAARFRDAAPEHREARRNLATALLQLGRLSEARVEFERALAVDPQDAEAALGMARLSRSGGDAKKALEFAEAALRLRPALPGAYFEAGLAALALGENDEAVFYCRQAVEQAPGDAAAHEALGSALEAAGFPQDAEQHLRRALELSPDQPSVLIKLGCLAQELGRQAEAEERFRAALAADPQQALALAHLGHLALKKEQPAEALAHFERALELQPEAAAVHNNLGFALQALGRHQEAVAACRRAIEINPNLAEPQHNLGAILQTLGRLDEARACYERALRLKPDMPAAILSLANLSAEAARAMRPAAIERLLQSRRLDDDARVQLHFARVRLHEARADHDAAFAAAVDGNAIEGRRRAYDAAFYEQLAGAIKETFTAEFFAERRDYGAAPDERPIFIVGMPRAGTTLIEQVLATHPQVFGAGELPFLPQLAGELRRWSRTARPFPHGVRELHEPEVLRLAGAYRRYTRGLAGPARRVTDKMTSNLFYLGFAALLFPGARIIYCRRDPFDLFISGYFMLFRNPLPHTTTQSNFAHFYRLQEELLRHWREVLPVTLHEVQYESFVGAQETQTRALLDYCELDWDARCLDFHLTDRPIRTGSDTQVRRPLYRHSVGRARPYMKHLGELEAALAGRRNGG